MVYLGPPVASLLSKPTLCQHSGPDLFSAIVKAYFGAKENNPQAGYSSQHRFFTLLLGTEYACGDPSIYGIQSVLALAQLSVNYRDGNS